jgi:hypothetical protein
MLVELKNYPFFKNISGVFYMKINKWCAIAVLAASLALSDTALAQDMDKKDDAGHHLKKDVWINSKDKEG